MSTVRVHSHHHQILRYATDLDLVPGDNEVDEDLLRETIRTTEGAPLSVRTLCDAGMLEIRRPQMAVKRGGRR